MYNFNKEYRLIVKGELDVIADNIEQFGQTRFIECNQLTNFLNKIKQPLISIEQKIGKNSIEYIDISTKIVDEVLSKLNNFALMDNEIEQLSTADTVKYYANQRSNLIESLIVLRTLEEMNMDYSYRINEFSKVKLKIERRCHEVGIDTRTSTQKGIDKLKTVGEFTGVVAKETAGCAFELAIKIAIVIVIFLILMAIIGVK